MINLSSIIGPVIGATVILLIALLTALFRIGKMHTAIESLENRMRRIESNYDNFISTLLTKTGGTGAKESEHVYNLLKKFDRYLEIIKPKGNPITKEDIAKLKKYRNQIAHSNAFTVEEYKEFETLAKKIESELPADAKNEFDWVIAGLLGVALGLLIAALLMSTKQN